MNTLASITITCGSIYGPKQIRISFIPLTIHLFTTVQPAMNTLASITITCVSLYTVQTN